MPPRKKPRASPAIETPTPATPAEKPQDSPSKIELEPELWTDEEESSLFKGMIRWKPVGMHKRFRMIALSQHMRNHGHNSEHTRPKGIWSKLDTLYNMKVLDERENATDDADSEERYHEFHLPAEDFHALMDGKRLDTERESSPEWLADSPDEEEEEDEDEEEDEEGEEDGSNEGDSDESSRASSAKSVRGGRNVRGARGRGRGRGRGQKESVLRGRTTAESAESAEDDDDDDDQDEDDEDEPADNVSTTKSTRARGSKARGARGGRATRRGRKRG